MRISQILRNKGSDVVVMRPDATVRELVAILNEHNLGAVVISAGGRSVDGIVSERDVVRHLDEGTDLLDRSVQSIMTPAAGMHTCTTHDTVDSLAKLMTERRVRHIPVLDDEGRLAGIVSIGDVVKSRIGELTFERDELEHYVAG